MWRSSIIVSILSIVCSFASFANQLAIAHWFGAYASLDAYFIAISIPMLFTGVVGGILSYSTVPLLVNRRVLESSDYPKFFGALLMAFTLSALIVALIASIMSEKIVAIIAPKLMHDNGHDVILMMRISWLNFLLATVTGYIIAVQNAEKKFLIPVFANLFPYIGMLLFILLFAKSMGVVSIPWGMSVGYLIAVPILYAGVSKIIWVSFSALKLYLKDIAAIFKRIPAVFLSTLCFTVYGTIDAYWATKLGQGNLSYLGYSQRLIIALGNLVVLGPLTVLTPYLSECFARNEKKEFSNILTKAVRITLILSSIFALILSMLRVPVIELLFQHGSFDAVATNGVASVLPGMLFGMVGMLVVTLLLKAMHSMGDITGAAIVGAMGFMLYFALSGILSKYMGLNGIVTSYALTWWLLLIVSLWRLYFQGISMFFIFDSFKFIAQIVISLLIAGMCIHLGKNVLIRPITEIGLINLSFCIGIISAIALFVYFLYIRLFRVYDIFKAIQKFK